jgi:hypothetical protein
MYIGAVVKQVKREMHQMIRWRKDARGRRRKVLRETSLGIRELA